MKPKNSFIWTVHRTLAFWVVGLLNTLFLKPEDLGSWKNYIGYFLLFLALIDTSFLIILHFRKTNIERAKALFLKVLAIVVPFYFIYLPQLQEGTENSKISNLWKYVLTGFLIYMSGIFYFGWILDNS